MGKYNFAVYLGKFLGTFCILYFGTKAIIGLTVPSGYYSPFVATYLDYPSLLRRSLLNGTRLLAALFGFDTHLRDAYRIYILNGRGVRLVYGCLGYGLLSFWIAFIVANKGNFIKKTKWIITGCFFIWFINVIRISLVLIANNQNWNISITMEQHTVFNITVYILIFFMIWLFHRSEKNTPLSLNKA